MREVTPELLKDARRANRITWEDADTDETLCSILLQGMAWLDGKIGADVDYGAEGLPKALLLDYSRYAMAGARHEFENDYLSDLVALGFQAEIRGMDTNEETGNPGLQ